MAFSGKDGDLVDACARRERHMAFDTAHPAVVLAYLVAALCLAMFSLQPVLVCVSLAGGLACCACARGTAATFSSMRWQLAVVAVIALFNPLFSASGSTELFRVGQRAVYLESFAYGLCMGALFMSTVLWCQAAAHLLGYDRLRALSGNVLPTVGLMVSMCMRLVPRFVRKGERVAAVQAAAGRGGGVAGRLRMSTVLMGWSMEDSLETADAMRARGWGGAPRRTSYGRHRFTGADAVALAGIALLASLAGACAFAATTQYSFFPTMSRLVAWWGYVPFAALMFLPTALHLAGAASWRRAERGIHGAS